MNKITIYIGDATDERHTIEGSLDVNVMDGVLLVTNNAAAEGEPTTRGFAPGGWQYFELIGDLAAKA